MNKRLKWKPPPIDKEGEFEYISWFKEGELYPSNTIPKFVNRLNIFINNNENNTPDIKSLPIIPNHIECLGLYFDNSCDDINTEVGTDKCGGHTHRTIEYQDNSLYFNQNDISNDDGDEFDYEENELYPTDGYFCLEKGYIKSNITKLYIYLSQPLNLSMVLGDYIPSSVTFLSLDCLNSFSSPFIPRSVFHLEIRNQQRPFHNRLNHKAPFLPSWVTCLDISFSKETLNLGQIPSTVKRITVSDFKSPIKRKHGQIIHYRVGKEFPEFIKQEALMDNIYLKNDSRIIPRDREIKHLFISNNSSISIGEVPCGVQTIQCNSDQRFLKIGSSFPDSVTYIELTKFNQCLSNLILPSSLKCLSLDEFDQPLYGNNHLPVSTTHLVISLSYKGLDIFTNSWIFSKGYFPKSIKFLKIKTNIPKGINLPSPILVLSTIDFIDIQDEYHDQVMVVQEKEYYLNQKKFNSVGDKKITHNLKYLDLGNSFNHPISPDLLPSSLTTFNFQPHQVTFIPTVFSSKNLIPPISFDQFNFNDNNYDQLLNYKFNNIYNISNEINKKSTYKEAKDFSFINSSSNQLFFIIWRIGYLKKKIITFMDDFVPSIITLEDAIYRPRVKQFKNLYIKDAFSNNFKTPYFTNHTVKGVKVLDDKTQLQNIEYPKSVASLNIPYSSGIPHWVTQLSVSSLASKTIEIPASVTDLCITKCSPLDFKDQIPPTVKILRMASLSKDSPLIIPSSVEILYIENQYLKLDQIPKYFIPQSIKKLIFHKNVYHNVKNIPKFISKRLYGNYEIYDDSRPISSDTNFLIWNENKVITKEIALKFPPCLTTIIFGNQFNQQLLNIPDMIQDIRLGACFNQKLYSVYFPKNLKYLLIGIGFKHPILKGSLPNGLTHLRFESLDPITSKTLNNIPNTVVHLQLPKSIYSSYIRNYFEIPGSVKHLYTGFHKTIIPSTLNSVSCSEINFDTDKDQAQLQPTELELVIDPFINYRNDQEFSLKVDKNFNQFILPNSLPSIGIKRIEFGDSFNQCLVENSLPSCIESIVFGKDFNQILDQSSLPSSLTNISFGRSFNKVFSPDIFIKNPSLNRLCFKVYFEGLFDLIPNSVKELEIGENYKDVNYSFNQLMIPIERVPTQIQTLILNDSEIIYSPSRIPPTIKTLRLCKCKTYDTLPSSIESLSLGIFKKNLQEILK
ncbi:hypothetical protein CYY_002029 [Polysphondylium violaceum]|uniref:FNIP repeat-containing protein n=1 Tax=Polysphondylium violaceum TaxID=133409 RepID=A0A8J4Q288_9MYCE|nr:hypothetical protein CYY_002029 [Polysphondylium violaceum]